MRVNTRSKRHPTATQPNPLEPSRELMDPEGYEGEASGREESSPACAGGLIFDQSARVSEVNTAAARLLGYTPVELVGLALGNLMASASYEKGRTFFKILLQLGAIKSELTLRRKDDTLCPVIMNAVKLADGRCIAYLLDGITSANPVLPSDRADAAGTVISARSRRS